MFWQPFIDTQNLTIEQLVLRLWVLFALIVFININETSRVRIECRSLPIERAWHTYNMSFPFFFRALLHLPNVKMNFKTPYRGLCMYRLSKSHFPAAMNEMFIQYLRPLCM